MMPSLESDRMVIKINKDLWDRTPKASQTVECFDDRSSRKRKKSLSVDIYDDCRDIPVAHLRPFLSFNEPNRKFISESIQTPVVLAYLRNYISFIPISVQNHVLMDCEGNRDEEEPCSILENSSVQYFSNLTLGNICDHMISLRVDSIQKQIRPTLVKLMSHPRNLNLFNSPVDYMGLNIPNYIEKISKPMDLGTVKSNLQAGKYESIQDCVADISLVFENALAYNPSTHYIYDIAKLLKQEFESDVVSIFDKYSKDHEKKNNHYCNFCFGAVCLLCGEKCLKFETPVLICQGSCNQRIKKNSVFYASPDGSYHWCQRCFCSLTPHVMQISNSNGESVPLLKKDLLKRKLDEEISEPWVRCDFCDSWLHQICALYDGQLESSTKKFMCPMCLIERVGGHFLSRRGMNHEDVVMETINNVLSCDNLRMPFVVPEPGVVVESTPHRNELPISSESRKRGRKSKSSDPGYLTPSISSSVSFSFDSPAIYKPSNIVEDYNDCIDNPSQFESPLISDDEFNSIDGSQYQPDAATMMPSRMKASLLPSSQLSDFLEEMVRSRLAETGFESVMESLSIRMVANSDQSMEVPSIISSNFMTEDGDCLPLSIPFRQKCILLFQTIDGIDVCVFCLYAQEYMADCPPPNNSKVYISYLDSVDYFRPIEARTLVYHEIMVGYLKWVQTRGFKQCHIWACPPQRGDNFIFWCHPNHQKTPSRDRLNSWYQNIIARCAHLGFVDEVRNLWEEYFQDYMNRDRDETQRRSAAKNSYVGLGKVCRKVKLQDEPDAIDETFDKAPVCPPIFEGDYWVVESFRAHRHALNRSRGYDGTDVASNTRRARDCIKSLMSKPNARPFNQPVDYVAWNLPQYPLIITSPMDLGTVKEKLRNMNYENIFDMAEDIRLTFQNAMKFNPPSHPIHQEADRLLRGFEETLSDIVVSSNFAFGSISTLSTEEVNTHLQRYRLSMKSDVTDENSTIPIENADLSPSSTDDRSSRVCFGEAVEEEEVNPPTRLQRVLSVCSDVSVAEWNRPVGMHPTLNISSSCCSMEFLRVKFESPALGEKAVFHMMAEISKGVQRLKDDLFVIRFSPVGISIPDSDDTMKSKLISAALRKVVPRLESFGLGSSQISSSALSLLSAIVADTSDPDQTIQSPFVESRHTFLEMCQYRHMQFDSLRRAKYSSFMLLNYLHNPYEEYNQPHCSNCRQTMRFIRWHCDQCSKYDICQGCFDAAQASKMRSHPHMLTPFRLSYY